MLSEVRLLLAGSYIIYHVESELELGGSLLAWRYKCFFPSFSLSPLYFLKVQLCKLFKQVSH